MPLSPPPPPLLHPFEKEEESLPLVISLHFLAFIHLPFYQDVRPHRSAMGYLDGGRRERRRRLGWIFSGRCLWFSPPYKVPTHPPTVDGEHQFVFLPPPAGMFAFPYLGGKRRRRRRSGKWMK